MAKAKETIIKETVCPWNLNSYFGRWMYYSWITNPKLNFTSSNTIDDARKLRIAYACGLVPNEITEAQLFYAKQVYENAYHPDTDEIQNVFGRLSFIPLGKTILVAFLLAQFAKGTPSYICHGLNQSYDSFVNYTNRNGDTKLAASQIRFGVSGIAATILSTLAAYRFEKLLNKKMCNPILYRFIPLSTLLMASAINVPITRNNEIIHGVAIYGCNKEKIGYSKFAALKGIGETIITRIILFAPGIYIINYLEDALDNRNCWFRLNQWAHFPFRMIGCGLILAGMLPTACAIFPQFSSVQSSTLNQYDKEAYKKIIENCTKIPSEVYFNKGL